METSVVGGGEGTDQFAKLSDDLAEAIFSRSAITLNKAARCSSILGKRWRYMWQSIDCAVLEFDKSDDDLTPEAKRRFVDRVDQAINLLQQSKTRRGRSSTFGGLRIGFKLLEMEEAAWKWIQFGLTERSMQLSLLSYLPRSCLTNHYGLPVPLLTPEFLCKQDLSRLEVLELQGLSEIPQGSLDHIFSHCPSLQRFSLSDCSFHDKDTVIRVRCSSLQRLTFHFPHSFYHHHPSRIEVISAPGLHRFEMGGGRSLPPVEFGDDIPQLHELQICDHGKASVMLRSYFPWSNSEFSKFAPRLQFLKFDISTFIFRDNYGALSPEWWLFERLKVLDLAIYMHVISSNLVHAKSLLRAAPMLRQMFISFVHQFECKIWKEYIELGPPTWKHHSLQVLQLHGVHGVHPIRGKVYVDPRKPQMELAASIIAHSPSLKLVVIDTRNLTSDASREPHQVDADILGARMELELRLQSHTADISQIHFTYR